MKDRFFQWTDGKEHYGNPNPQYDPTECGLEIVAELNDPNASYSFDDILVWRDVATGDLYAAHDSGCSCPTPFEDYRKLSDLTPILSTEAFRDFVRQHQPEDVTYLTWPLRNIYTATSAVEAALAKR